MVWVGVVIKPVDVDTVLTSLVTMAWAGVVIKPVDVDTGLTSLCSAVARYMGEGFAVVAVLTSAMLFCECYLDIKRNWI